MYPLREVLLLVTCATIAACDDFDDIVAWGKHHLDFLRRFSEFHHGIPRERWVRKLVNRVDPILFGRLLRKLGFGRCGRTGTTSSLSTARRRGVPTTAARGSRPCTRSAPTRPSGAADAGAAQRTGKNQ